MKFSCKDPKPYTIGPGSATKGQCQMLWSLTELFKFLMQVDDESMDAMIKIGVNLMAGQKQEV